MSTATLDEGMPEDPGFLNGTGANVSGMIFTAPNTSVPNVTIPSQTDTTPASPFPDPKQIPKFSIDPGGNTNPALLIADGSMPVKGKWDNIVLDDTELCAKTPEELLELIKQMREIEQMLDPILLKLIEDVSFAPQFDKLKKFRETNLEMLRLAMNIFNKKVESKYDLAPAAGKKRGTKPS